MSCSKHKTPRAFTLLEVILALAILAGAVAVLGEVMSIAGRHTSDAQAQTRAQLLANSLMDELISGITPVEQQTRLPLEVDDSTTWVASIVVEATDVNGLLTVEVLVEQDIDEQFHPVTYRLVRWIPSQSEVDNQQDNTDKSAGGNGA